MINQLELNVRKTLEYCQESETPFTYWDEEEVDAIEGLPFPFLSPDSVCSNWRIYGDFQEVDLSSENSIQEFKEMAKADIKVQKLSPYDIGYAFIRAVGSVVRVQAYIQ